MALLLQSANKDSACIEKGRCVFNPTKKELFCSSAAIDYCAGISVLMVYYKILDDIKDSGFFKAIIYRFLKLVVMPSYYKAKKQLKAADCAIKKSVVALDELEKQKSPNMDMAASTFYDMLAFIGSDGANDEKTKRIVYEISKNVGRWIYILDAYNDIDDDVKNKRYNPLVYRYKFLENQEDTLQFSKRIQQNVEFTLDQCLYNLANAFELLEDQDSAVLKNIVYLGLPQKQHSILFQKGRKKDGSV
jgi:hypothetical protein